MHGQPSTLADQRTDYRADIDGLRAVAILAVVGFHAFPVVFHGGFVGVDVFFVISGYLITTIILKDLREARFSFLTFYIRRIRRIFPALAVVLTACLLFGWFALLPDEYRSLGKHTAGAAAFVTNFVLWTENGYFAPTAAAEPLLHLWSLGIEEQFYLAWPLLLWTAARFNLSGALIVILAAASFAFGVQIMVTSPVAAFYSPASRVWELMIGAWLAWYVLDGHMDLSKHAADRLSVVGIILIILSATLLSGYYNHSNFPGWLALGPTAGAAALIAAGPGAIVNRKLLSTKIMRWIGDISYPLYLWHWPLLSFAYIITGEWPSPLMRVEAMALAFALASLTYYFVERPLRRGAFGIKQASMLTASIALIGMAGFVVYKHDGIPSRAAATPTEYETGEIGQRPFYDYMKAKFYPCASEQFLSSAPRFENIPRCFQSKPGLDLDIAIVGDSHAEQLFLGLADALPDKNVVYLIQNSAPLLGNKAFDPIFPYVTSTRSFKVVILTALWSGRIGEFLEKDDSPKRADFVDQLARTLQALKASGKEVNLTDDIPLMGFNPAICKYERRVKLGPRKCSITSDESNKQQSKFLPEIEAAAKRADVPILKTWGYFCAKDGCSMERNGQLLYRDEHHVNIGGSQYVGKRLVEDYPPLGGAVIRR